VITNGACTGSNLPVSEIKTMEERWETPWRTRVSAWLLTAFAALAAANAMASWRDGATVVQRTAEIGIRIALARSGDVLMLVLGRAALVTVAASPSALIRARAHAPHWRAALRVETTIR
jgi:hypothetical protein